MVVFVNEGFPGVSKLHNTLANRMNVEINKQQMNVPIEIPLVVDGMAAEEDEEDESVATLWKLKQGVAKAKPARSGNFSKMVDKVEANWIHAELETREGSPPSSSFPPITNTELVRRQNSAALSSASTNVNTKHAEPGDHDSGVVVKPLDILESWNDSPWPYGACVDGLEIIDVLP